MCNPFVCLLLTKESRNGNEGTGPWRWAEFLCSTRLTFTALGLAAVMHATNPALAQNINDLPTIFGGYRQRALRHAALAEWRRLSPAEIACIDKGLRQKGFKCRRLSPQGSEALGRRIG